MQNPNIWMVACIYSMWLFGPFTSELRLYNPPPYLYPQGFAIIFRDVNTSYVHLEKEPSQKVHKTQIKHAFSNLVLWHHSVSLYLPWNISQSNSALFPHHFLLSPSFYYTYKYKIAHNLIKCHVEAEHEPNNTLWFGNVYVYFIGNGSFSLISNQWDQWFCDHVSACLRWCFGSGWFWPSLIPS